MFQQPRVHVMHNIEIREEDLNSITDEVIECFRLISQVIVAISLELPEQEIDPIKADAIDYARGKQDALEHPVLRMLLNLLINGSSGPWCQPVGIPEIIVTATNPETQELVRLYHTASQNLGWTLPPDYIENIIAFSDQIKVASREPVYMFK